MCFQIASKQKSNLRSNCSKENKKNKPWPLLLKSSISITSDEIVCFLLTQAKQSEGKKCFKPKPLWGKQIRACKVPENLFSISTHTRENVCAPFIFI